MTEPADPRPEDADDLQTTSEIGDEGGSPGDVEVDVSRAPGAGGEADETWKRGAEHRDVVIRDERGVGRRSP